MMTVVHTLDFETEAIQDGTPIPPRPVGFSIKANDNPSYYYAFGHSSGNTHTWAEAEEVLHDVIGVSKCVVFHNAKFDLAVLEHWFHIKLDPSEVHDTLAMAFINNPHEASLGLKPLADKYLKMPPEEQQDLKNWIIDHVKAAGEKTWGGYIAQAPADLVGKYANGDVDRTKALYDFFMRPLEEDHAAVSLISNSKASSYTAYKNEVKLIPIITKVEQQGVRLSDEILDEREYWQQQFNKGEKKISAVVGDVKLGGKTMFNVLKSKGLIDESKLQFTEKGNPKYGREFLPDVVKDAELVEVLTRRSKLSKILGTYLNPWAESYKANNKRFYPYFNATRTEEGSGTRTGRFSSNFQQVPKEKAEGYPHLRKLIWPDDGEILLVRDFSAQEVRVAAHFAEGNIMKAYQDDPDLDVHTFVQNLVKQKVGMDLPRRISKTITFLKLYGGGPQKLVDQIDCSLDDAKAFFRAYDAALPEFKGISVQAEEIARSGKKLRTHGGRLFTVEPPEIRPDGRKWEKYYKLSNFLIQGSSADMTKQAMLAYEAHPERRGRLVLQVHDELVCSVKPEHRVHEMEVLRECMEHQTGWDVPIRSSGDWGTNYGELVEMDHELGARSW